MLGCRSQGGGGRGAGDGPFLGPNPIQPEGFIMPTIIMNPTPRIIRTSYSPDMQKHIYLRWPKNITKYGHKLLLL